MSVASVHAQAYRSFRHARRTWSWRRLLSLPHLFAALWVVVLLWGERWVFESSIESCRWENWEQWVRLVSYCWMDDEY
jgi:hypothetical protein